jgi:hypothetical protein
MFEFDIWIIGPDYKRYWYSRCSSVYYADKRADMFRKETPPELYKMVLITFTPKQYATWDVGKEYNPSIFKKVGTIYVAEE